MLSWLLPIKLAWPMAFVWLDTLSGAVQETAFSHPWWNDRVFYEVFVRSFKDSNGDGIGDLTGLIEQLDYLNDGDPKTTTDLGVTGLWLMPIAESSSYHGYDVVDYVQVEKDYGDNPLFKRLVHKAHQRGMAVILDLVINHTSKQHPWFVEAASSPQAKRRNWYVWSDEDPGTRGPWGQPVWHRNGEAFYYALFWDGMPDLNYRNPEVTREMQQILLFWMQDMEVDGFRLDAVRHLIEEEKRQEDTPETHQWLRGIHSFVKSQKPDALLIGEVWASTETIASYGSAELDLCFEFDLASAILKAVSEGNPSILFTALSMVLKLYPPNQFGIFLTNHDQNRVMTRLDNDENKAKLAASIYLTLPGVPFVYYGEEIGMSGEKPDENLRTPMQWTNQANAGFSSTIPWRPIHPDYPRINVETEFKTPNSLLRHYQNLIRLRSRHSALRTGSTLLLDSDAGSVFGYIRHNEKQDVLVVHNLGMQLASGYTLSIPGSPLRSGKYTLKDLLGNDFKGRIIVQKNGAIRWRKSTPPLGPLESRVLLVIP